MVPQILLLIATKQQKIFHEVMQKCSKMLEALLQTIYKIDVVIELSIYTHHMEKYWK